jgi:tRNA A-37 threonylcarbamoyl transferase component Bud32
VSINQKYQILKLVAKGGTAVLYSAVQTSLDRVVAIKKLHQHLTEDENFTRRFVLEAKAAASLDHDNIVKIIDFGIEDDAYIMVMEFIEGESLREILDKCKQLRTETALAIAYETALGLEHAHSKGIVHRDIKPGNIMLTKNGRVKITDFGLAKLTQQTSQHTAADSILGTPLYMSPEQAFGETVDHRSDLFSLGTTLYEMLTGAQPFRDEHYMAVIQNIIKKNVPHPSKFNVEIPAPVQSILSKAMNKSREARFQSAGDFKRSIEKYLGFNELKNASEGLKYLLKTDGDTLVLRKTAVRTRRRRLRAGFVVALVLSVLIGAAQLGYSYGPEPLQQKMESIVTWLDEKNPFALGADSQLGGFGSGVIGSDSIFTSDSTVMSATAEQRDNGAATSGVVTDMLRPSAKDARPEKTAPPTVRTAASMSSPSEPIREPAAEPAREPAREPAPQQNTKTARIADDPEAVEKRPEEKKGWLSITVDPWAEVYIDGVYQGDTPPLLRVELLRGAHRVECRNPGYKPYAETVQITAGELSNRRVILKKLKGWLRITTTPGAEVYVDGTLVGVTPLNQAIELDAGNHQVTVKKLGFNLWNNRVTVTSDQELPLTITMSPTY